MHGPLRTSTLVLTQVSAQAVPQQFPHQKAGRAGRYPCKGAVFHVQAAAMPFQAQRGSASDDNLDCKRPIPKHWQNSTIFAVREEGVCRLWSQRIALKEPLPNQICQAEPANCHCICEPQNRARKPPSRSL